MESQSQSMESDPPFVEFQSLCTELSSKNIWPGTPHLKYPSLSINLKLQAWKLHYTCDILISERETWNCKQKTWFYMCETSVSKTRKWSHGHSFPVRRNKIHHGIWCLMLEFQSVDLEFGLTFQTWNLILIIDSACQVMELYFLSDLTHNMWGLNLQAKNPTL